MEIFKKYFGNILERFEGYLALQNNNSKPSY